MSTERRPAILAARHRARLELNQVWTNLIDNAIDALGDSGTTTVRTRLDGACAELDDFFTTKDVGAGTGLGLATARRIVVDRHDGSLNVASRPGATTFTVRLPLAGTRSS